MTASFQDSPRPAPVAGPDALDDRALVDAGGLNDEVGLVEAPAALNRVGPGGLDDFLDEPGAAFVADAKGVERTGCEGALHLEFGLLRRLSRRALSVQNDV